MLPTRTSSRHQTLGILSVLRSTLPYRYYTDESVLELEHDAVFAPSWQYAANTSDVPKTGDIHPVVVNQVPLLLTRSGDSVHALLNVCAHRGSILCRSPQSSKYVKCPYHAWTYELDGSLHRAPRSEHEPDFDASSHSLQVVPVETWGPFIFVSTRLDPEPFADWLGDLPTAIEASGVSIDELRFHSRMRWEVAANWKICVENFLECYHCRVAHPDFSKAIDTSRDGYELETAPTYSTQRGPVREGWRGEFDPVGPVPRGQFHLLYPNTAINIMPGRPNLSIGPVVPTSPSTTTRFLDYFFGPEVPDTWIDGMLQFDDQVGKEDIVLIENMQEGVSVDPERSGTLFVDSELLIAHFASYVRSHIG